MKADVKISHKFVDLIPEDLADKTIYVSIPHATAAHKCACGCGHEIITPLSPTDWTLLFDGETVSLDPSIGNWSYPCRSHYWIIEDRITWSPAWSQEEIAAGRADDRAAKDRYFSGHPSQQQLPNTNNKAKSRLFKKQLLRKRKSKNGSH